MRRGQVASGEASSMTVPAALRRIVKQLDEFTTVIFSPPPEPGSPERPAYEQCIAEAARVLVRSYWELAETQAVRETARRER